MQNFFKIKTGFKIFVLALAFVVIASGLIYFFGFSAPKNYSGGEVDVIVDSGQSVIGIARELKQNNIVRSAVVAQSLMVMFGGERNIKAGMYVFKSPQNVFSVAHRIASGDFGYVPIKLTVPEGTNSKKLSSLVASKFPQIDSVEFYNVAKTNEGYLFPETYFFAPKITAELIIDRMQGTFTAELKPYEDEIKKSGRSSEDIIKMASILEAEVQTDEDRKIVADLLWRRLDSGMALQVDSTLGYVLDKTSAELTLTDLRTDNPYNSYINKGLPPTPISNPGLESILAALRPTHNSYLFYLSDKNGITHFAKTYEQHLANKKKYLK